MSLATMSAGVSGTPIGNARTLLVLVVVLSLTAGCADVIGFLVFNGLFTAHITGNLVILAAHIAAGTEAQIAKVLSVPVFLAMLILTRLVAGVLEWLRLDPLRPLLLLQFLLLAGCLVLDAAIGPHAGPNATIVIVAGMFGVSAMATQNALVQISLKGEPPTAVMTSNLTRFAADVGDMLLGGGPDDIAKARDRAARTLPAIVGFAVGCGVGAACEAALGSWSLALPAGFALLALAVAFGIEPGTGNAGDTRLGRTRQAGSSRANV